MYRRSILRALFGTVGVSGLAGCNALLGDSSATPTPGRAPSSTAGGSGASGASGPSRGADTTRTQTSADPPAREPYRAPERPSLDRPRGIHVRNLGSTARFLTVVVADGDRDREVFADSAPVPPGETASFSNLLATTGRYDVLVETADGERRRYDWTVHPDLDDLWVDLTPQLSFRRPVLYRTDSPFVVADEDRRLAYEIPAAVDVAAALGRAPALALDNDGPSTHRVRLHVWNAGQLDFAASFDLPPDVRLLVPVFPASQRYDIVVRTDDGEAIYDWQPSVRNTLYAAVADTPVFRCGYADHDVRVRNETSRAQDVVVRVLTGDETLFERTFDLDPGERETVPSAVDPAGPFNFSVEVGGRTERYNWVRCAPNGPITVAVSDDGVYVSVRPTRES